MQSGKPGRRVLGLVLLDNKREKKAALANERRIRSTLLAVDSLEVEGVVRLLLQNTASSDP